MSDSSVPKNEPIPSVSVEIPKKNINLKIILPVVILVVIVGAFVFSYIQTASALESATVSTMQTYGVDYTVTNLTLLPPGADLTLLLNLKNPSSIDLDLKIGFTIYYDNSVLAPFNGALSLAAGQAGVVQFTPFHIGSEIITKLNDKSRITRQLTITGTTKVWGLVPIAYAKTVNA